MRCGRQEHAHIVGADAQGETREGEQDSLRRSAGGCYEEIRSSRDPEARGTMWKTARPSASRLESWPHHVRTTPAIRRPHPQRTLHKDRTGGDMFLFTHLPVEVSVLFICYSFYEDVNEEVIPDKQPVFEETKESNEYIHETIPTAYIETEISQFQDEREPEK